LQPTHELAQILRAHWTAIEQETENKRLNTWQLRTLSALSKCRTSALGGHIDGCTTCGHMRISYNSCRNRHCPKCQGNEREAWIQARQDELLPVSYFHVVFTLPSELNGLCINYPKVMYAALFDSAWDTIAAFAKDEKHLAAAMGMISILHTWGQQLTLHPHMHCIIPAGGLNKLGYWKNSKNQGNYLFPVRALSMVFRAKYIHHVRKRVALHNLQQEKQIILPREIINLCFKKEWVVYAKKPFSGVNSVVEYLGRYTHKIAISNHRIADINYSGNTVTIKYKDYKTNGSKKQLTLNTMEFVRRFAMHILPKGFTRIRHYGILSSTAKTKAIEIIRKQFASKKTTMVVTKAEPFNPLHCTCCKKESMIRLINFDHRGPPSNWKLHNKNLLQSLKTT
jgi:hypothetical protein